MSDTLPTVWAYEPHTKAKHQILKRYLEAWMPILSTLGFPQIKFIDAFAGPGVYAGGQDGSPILAVKAALEHKRSFEVPIQFFFIEYDRERFEHLKRVLEQYKDRIASSPNLTVLPPRQGDCGVVLDELLREYEVKRTAFGPALVFLDQFGYTDVPITLIRRIMSHRYAEVFTYLNCQRLSQYLADRTKDAGRTAAFGSDSWKDAMPVSGQARVACLRERYKRSLHELGGAKYVWDFAMVDAKNQLLYWLFFCTGDLKGLYEMKKAMWSVDETGSFRFLDSDDPAQPRLLQLFGDSWLVDHLSRHFMGQTMTVGQVKNYVLTETLCFSYAKVMQQLRREGRLERADGGTGGISFANELTVSVRFTPGAKPRPKKSGGHEKGLFES